MRRHRHDDGAGLDHIFLGVHADPIGVLVYVERRGAEENPAASLGEGALQQAWNLACCTLDQPLLGDLGLGRGSLGGQSVGRREGSAGHGTLEDAHILFSQAFPAQN